MSIRKQAAALFATLVSTADAIDAWDDDFALPDHLSARYAEAARTLATLGESTRALLDEMLAMNDVRVRREAAHALGRLGGTGSTDVLLGRLDGDGDDEVRVACAVALGAGRDPRAVTGLRLALRDRDARARHAATVALTACDPEIVCDLLDEAQLRPRASAPVALDAGQPGHLAASLGTQLGPGASTPVALDAVQLEHLAASLAASADQRAMAHLVRLASDADGKVRAAAFRSLAPRLEGRPELADELLRPCLSAPGVGEAAAAHIGLELARRGRPIADAMIPLTRSTSHVAAVLSSRALVHEARLSGSQVTDVALRGPNALARQVAIDELRDAAPDLARDDLRRLLALASSDEDPRNASRAVEVVAELGLADELVAEIVALLAREDAGRAWFHRANAMIERFGERASGPLVALLGHADPVVRGRAAWWLKGVRSTKAREALRAALRDPVDAVRANAERALAAYPDPDVMRLRVERHRRAEQSLVERARSIDPKRDDHDLADECVLCNTAKDIGRTRHPEAYAWLVELAERTLAVPPKAKGELSRAAYYRAIGCIEGLGFLGDPRGAQWILRALVHSDFRMRRDAAGALAELGDPAHESALRAALADSSAKVRAAARRAIDALEARRPSRA